MSSNKTIEQILNKDGVYLSTTIGDSMEPMLFDRQNTVVIKKIDHLLNKYDSPLYKRPNGKYVLHRIIKINKKKKYYVTLGDNRYKSEKVPFDWVIGYLEGYYVKDTYITTTNKKYVSYVKKLKRHLVFRRTKLMILRLFKL